VPAVSVAPACAGAGAVAATGVAGSLPAHPAAVSEQHQPRGQDFRRDVAPSNDHHDLPAFIYVTM